jgi:hypothetical protein
MWLKPEGALYCVQGNASPFYPQELVHYFIKTEAKNFCFKTSFGPKYIFVHWGCAASESTLKYRMKPLSQLNILKCGADFG